jgi:hypothetical protein
VIELQIVGWFLIILGSVLGADAVMALFFGRRYLHWGAGFLPGEYRDGLRQFMDMPRRTIVLLALLELALALSLHWLGFNLTGRL